eukprot:Tbor_TRINITY_DN4134_c0_g1::TRINITY_DN4134_c0_g1_i2::g.26449::m.26449
MEEQFSPEDCDLLGRIAFLANEASTSNVADDYLKSAFQAARERNILVNFPEVGILAAVHETRISIRSLGKCRADSWHRMGEAISVIAELTDERTYRSLAKIIRTFDCDHSESHKIAIIAYECAKQAQVVVLRESNQLTRRVTEIELVFMDDFPYVATFW